MYKILIKPILFLFPAETAHNVSLKILKWVFKIPILKKAIAKRYDFDHPKLSTSLLNLHFKNPIGLAAGFDKDAKYLHELKNFGFGFIEIGTLTPKAQKGNPKPRLFRLPKDKALLNRMGFNNNGVHCAVNQLKKRPKNIIIGGNIGKNKDTPNHQALEDYLQCYHHIAPYVDYLVINISSPNTPHLRELQNKAPLENLLKTLSELNEKSKNTLPLWVKIAPDISHTLLQDIVSSIERYKIAGIIATNTTIDKENLKTPHAFLNKLGKGGISGLPLKDKSNNIIRLIRLQNKTIPIMAVGGILSKEDAIDKLNAGANLIQIYSGFVYEGPRLIKEIKKAIIQNQHTQSNADK